MKKSLSNNENFSLAAENYKKKNLALLKVYVGRY